MAISDASNSRSSDSTMIPRWVKRCERACCMSITYFPLFFVYSMTGWAVWVETSIGWQPSKSIWIGKGSSFLGILLYGMLTWSYTTAVFTSPGTTTDKKDGYSSLPSHAPPNATSFTVKSNGELRFCKKCQARKPDRAHHCRTCNACVLKMDHHCPWLATCVGLRNYKPFMLFLIYTVLFCALCSFVSVTWLWTEIFEDSHYTDSLMPVNYVMLAVISTIIGLVLGGFTGWHLLLSKRGQTTIECLEKTRYLSPIRQSTKFQHIPSYSEVGRPGYDQQLRSIHAEHHGQNGVRTGTGLEPGFPAQQSYEEMERQRARARYQDYLDEQDSEKLPNAFDLGWRRNLLHLFGPNRWLWALPICNTTGDGWSWEPSKKWLDAREAVRTERDLQRQREHAAGWGPDPAEYDDILRNSRKPEPITRHYVTASGARSPNSAGPRASTRHMSKADKVLGRDPSLYLDEPGNHNSMPMQTLRSRDLPSDDEDFDCDDELSQSGTPPRETLKSFKMQGLRAANAILGRGADHAPPERSWNANDDEVD